MTATLKPAKSTNIKRELKRIASRSTDRLRQEVGQLLMITATNIVKLAARIAELERRGVDLSDMRISLLPHLRSVAAGQALAETIVSFVGSPLLLAQVCQLSHRDQRRLVDSPRVKVFDATSNEVREKDLLDLHATEVYAIFKAGTIRTPEQQRDYLSGSRKEPEPKYNFKLTADVDNKVLRVGRSILKPADVVAALSRIAGKLGDVAVEDSETATVRLTAKEKANIRAAEKRRGLPEWHLIREALHAYGLI